MGSRIRDIDTIGTAATVAHSPLRMSSREIYTRLITYVIAGKVQGAASRIGTETNATLRQRIFIGKHTNVIINNRNVTIKAF